MPHFTSAPEAIPANYFSILRIQGLMSKTQMIAHVSEAYTHVKRRRARVLLASAALLIFSLATATDSLGQRHFSRTYPARGDVRLELTNRTGTITVESWERNLVKVSAEMEAPAARFTPEINGNGMVINVLRDNSGQDVGDVNFRIFVPVNATVDLETRRGQITVRGVRGEMVRAHVSSEGDIELTDIRAGTVVAENTMGNILFDAELIRGGSYSLRSAQGDISVRLSADSGFNLTADAPHTRRISLGEFENLGKFDLISGGRRIIGRVGEGAASLFTTDLRGSIHIMRR